MTIISLDSISTVFDDSVRHQTVPLAILSDTKLQRIKTFLDEMKNDLMNKKTARLRLQYLEIISLLQKCITAERTGIWSINMQVVTEMLHFSLLMVTTSSPRQHVCTCRWCTLHNLHDSHPSIYKAFKEGGHIIRRSDRFWAGLSADLLIEQEYIRSLKTSGGLTRGGGMTESEGICGFLNIQMQHLTNTNYSTNDRLSIEEHNNMITTTASLSEFQSINHLLKVILRCAILPMVS